MKKEIEFKTLNEYFAYLMHSRHQSVREVARQLKTSPATISRITNGQNFELKLVIPIAQWCSLTPQELWGLMIK